METSKIVSPLWLNADSPREMDLLWLLVQVSSFWGMCLNRYQAPQDFTSQISHSSFHGADKKRRWRENPKDFNTVFSWGESPAFHGKLELAPIPRAQLRGEMESRTETKDEGRYRGGRFFVLIRLWVQAH